MINFIRCFFILLQIACRKFQEIKVKYLSVDIYLKLGREHYMQKEINKLSVVDECRKMSVRTKMLLLLSIALFIFGFSAAAINYELYMNSSIEQHKQLGTGIANLVVEALDPDRVNEYLEKGRSAEGYEKTERILYLIRESSPDIKFLYVYKIMEDGCHVVFDLDTEGDVQPTTIGSIEPFEEEFNEYIPALLQGKKIEPIISDGTYGWLLSVYIPVYDSNGVCQCYAGVDISMDNLRKQSQDYMMKLVIIFFCIFVLILWIGFQLANHNVILPINKMAHFAGVFAYNNEEAMEYNLKGIRNLKINTGDEIENLYKAFVKMTEDSVQYTKDVKTKNETISKMQSALIVTLADLVESRDENTGQHIKKTAAYVKIILEELKREGVYKEQLTDSFINNVINSAPLHDIGKIAVPDAILNKPGKLTKEEFDLMKTHTTAGGKIISSIIEMVPDSHYLDEAKNLATYHHERWDGAGYPTGLAGENIPLSARIMAVADVFDALVSKRSYKEGFPYDKALNIIKEERGTHFDPKLVDAFLAVKEKVLSVAREFNKE